MKTAKLFKNGESQAVRLPKEFRFKGKEVYVKKTGDAVVLLPVKGAWSGLRGVIEKFSGDFMQERHQPPVQKRERPFR